MDLLTVLAVAGVVAPVGFTAHRILGRVRRFAAEQAGVRVLRGFADAFARELEVGSLPVAAAGHALDAVASDPEATRPGGVQLVEQLGVEIRRIRLGAVPGSVTAVPGSATAVPGTDHAPDEGLRRLLAVWASAYRHGTALGGLVGRVRDDLDARLTHLGHTSGALAGARLTETILLLLPVGAVGVGQSMGLHPAAFLLGNVLGVLLLVGGVLLGCAGALWTESLTVTVLGGVGRRAGPDRLAAARLLDLFAESLAAGLPAAVAWGAAVDCCFPTRDDGGDADSDDHDVRTVAALLALGAGAAGWEPLLDDPAFGPVARSASSGARNGARLAEGVRAQAARLRQDAADASLAGAERVLVVVAAPLTLCFLPAFVLVGLLPLVAGFAGV